MKEIKVYFRTVKALVVKGYHITATIDLKVKPYTILCQGNVNQCCYNLGIPVVADTDGVFFTYTCNQSHICRVVCMKP